MASVTVQEALQAAAAALNAGQAESASVWAARVLHAVPHHPAALHLAGCSAYNLGRTDEAVSWLERARQAAPDHQGIVANLARAELRAGRVEIARRRAWALAHKQPQARELAAELERRYLQRQRPAALAGRFYAAQAGALAAQVDALLAQAHRELPTSLPLGRCPKVLVLPHAGHVYSGAMAARGYAALQPHLHRIRRIVMVGPAHRVALTGVGLPGVGSFVTPLGAVEIDSLAADTVADMADVQSHPQAHAQEHCLEVHLPFIQRLWKGQRLPALLPVVVGGRRSDLVRPFLERLWGNDDTLLIISTDLSHYHSYDEAQSIDAQACERIMALDSTLHHGQACGATPLNAVLHMARQRRMHIEALGRCNSGDTHGNTPEGRQRVVGYASFALYDTQAAPVDAVPDELGQRLLGWARHALHQSTGAPALLKPEADGLDAQGATFVTLTQNGRLRGCIGSLRAYRSLLEDVQANAKAAALKDPRFPPVSAQEAPRLAVEVSVLAPAQGLAIANESHALWQLRPGIDGVILACDHQGRTYRSTFLPQVWSQMPDPRQFMAALKAKAGLSADFWSPQMSLHTYSVHKFSESDVAGAM